MMTVEQARKQTAKDVRRQIKWMRSYLRRNAPHALSGVDDIDRAFVKALRNTRPAKKRIEPDDQESTKHEPTHHAA
jgi:hypothetical protein